MNPKLKTIFLWALPIILIIGLSWQLLESSCHDKPIIKIIGKAHKNIVLNFGFILQISNYQYIL